jgi:hypothetical protein
MTRADGERTAQLERAAEEFRRRARETDDPSLRRRRERHARDMEQLSEHSRRHAFSVANWCFAATAVIFPWAVANRLGYGWLGAVLSVFVAIALLVRWRVAASDD